MSVHTHVATLLRARGLPAEARSNGEVESVVIELLSSVEGEVERLVFASSDKGWGYTHVDASGIVEVGWFDDLDLGASPEDVANYIVDNIDFIFDAN